MIIILALISSISADVCCLPETTESSTSNPGTSTSDSDNTNQPTDSQTSSSSQSNTATTPQASAIADDATSMIFTESQASPSKGAPLIAALTGGSTGAMLLILVVVIAVASFAVCVRSGKCHKNSSCPSASPDNDDDLSINYNNGISMHPVAKCRYSLENMYDSPNTVFPSVEKLETKRNAAYNVTLATVDEVTKPIQGQNSFEYDYVQ